MPTQIDTALSYHGRCFVCRRANVRIHKVGIETVAKAYCENHIYVKHHARCRQTILFKYDIISQIQDQLKTSILERLD